MYLRSSVLRLGPSFEFLTLFRRSPGRASNHSWFPPPRTISPASTKVNLWVRGSLLAGGFCDENSRPLANTLVEIWQANAAGRYLHEIDQHKAPLDPNFTGVGQAITDSEGRYRFVTIRPGEYPWRNHYNAWRPAHIHFSLFGPAFATRLVTQMYFPGDPLIPFDPIFNCTADETREKPADFHFRLGIYGAGTCLGIPLRHRASWTRGNSDGGTEEMSLQATPSQTVGPYFRIGLQWLHCDNLAPEGVGRRTHSRSGPRA